MFVVYIGDSVSVGLTVRCRFYQLFATVMWFILLVFINACAVGLSIACVNFYFQHSWQHFVVTFVISFAISFLPFYYLFQRYIYGKITPIYKLFHNLKLGKAIKDALGEKMTDDPINDVKKQVRKRAKEKKKK